MRKLKIPRLIILTILSIFLSQTLYAKSNWSPAQGGNKIILIRHSIAPGGGDPPGFKINDCKTQRNLSQEGINQSKKIGKLFLKNKVKIDQVLTSQWCRCKDTAKYAFEEYKDFPALNSFFRQGIGANAKKQLTEIKDFVKNWNSTKNLVLITHQVVISNSINETVSSGEMVITNKNFKVLARIPTL